MKSLEIILNFRKYILKNINSLSVEELNAIPDAFNNNIIWNIGHMNAVLNALCYRTAGLPVLIDQEYFLPYLPGTKPQGPVKEDEILTLKEAFLKNAEQLQNDLTIRSFQNYVKVEKIETVYNIKIESIEDAIKYITHHEGIHFNAIMAIKRNLINS